MCGHYPQRQPPQLLIDAGSIAFSKDVIDYKAGAGQAADPSKPTPGFGGVKGWPGLSIVSLSQESAKLEMVDGSDIPFAQLPVGSHLLVQPNHSCLMAAQHADYIVLDNWTQVVGKWKACKGW